MWWIEIQNEIGDNVMWVLFCVNPGWFEDISVKTCNILLDQTCLLFFSFKNYYHTETPISPSLFAPPL